MTTSTIEERDAFLWMQGRLIELLLRHEATRFRDTFGHRSGNPDRSSQDLLQRYRELAVLFYLRDDLFDSILPRIKRRLSFVAPRTLVHEEPPARGRIDWPRTLAAEWRDHPGEAPLSMVTRQRRRHFSTPENLLTVVTLLEYRDAVTHLLDTEATASLALAIRHPLNEIVAACTRELVFPQFAGLVPEGRDLLSGLGRVEVEDLEAQVAEHLLPGHNSAYDDLLIWRQHLRDLQLLERTADLDLQLMLGADPKRDNYLYQLWLFYEWGNLLQQQGRLLEWSYPEMTLRFTWGDNVDQREYCLQHDRSIPGAPAYWTTGEAAIPAPGVRPDFYIWRPDRDADAVRNGKQLIWRPPGYMLDAKYYKPRTSIQAPSNPVKRMISDLQLTSEHHGALLFAFQGGPNETIAAIEGTEELEPDLAEMPSDAQPLYTLAPIATTAQSIPPDLRIAIWRVQPTMTESETLVARTLEALLKAAHRALKDRVPVRCHGIFLDTLTATAHGDLASTRGLHDRNGTLIMTPLDDLLLCPKPHVAPWRVDLVSREHDCWKNPERCHIKHLLTSYPPTPLDPEHPDLHGPARLNALDAIVRAIQDTEEPVADPDRVAADASQRVRVIAQRYRELLQPDITQYYDWIRDKLDIGTRFDTTPLLGPEQRETLALARFLWEQLDNIRAQNFAGPALLFTGVLEWATQKSLHKKRPTLYTTDGSNVRLGDTLGTLGNCKDFGGANWPILEQAINSRGYWKEQIVPGHSYSFSRWIDTVRAMVPIRNAAAHKARVERESFTLLISGMFGSAVTGVGALNGLLLAWVPQGGYQPPTS